MTSYLKIDLVGVLFNLMSNGIVFDIQIKLHALDLGELRKMPHYWRCPLHVLTIYSSVKLAKE